MIPGRGLSAKIHVHHVYLREAIYELEALYAPRTLMYIRERRQRLRSGIGELIRAEINSNRD